MPLLSLLPEDEELRGGVTRSRKGSSFFVRCGSFSCSAREIGCALFLSLFSFSLFSSYSKHSRILVGFVLIAGGLEKEGTERVAEGKTAAEWFCFRGILASRGVSGRRCFRTLESHALCPSLRRHLSTCIGTGSLARCLPTRERSA